MKAGCAIKFITEVFVFMRKLLILVAAALLLVPHCASASIFPEGSEAQLEYEQQEISQQQSELNQDIATVTQEIQSDEKKIATEPPVTLPLVYGLSLALVPESARAAVTAEAEGYVAAGRPDKAASVIGRALGTANSFSTFYLGNFCLTALPKAGDPAAQADFMTGFMRGYNKCGLLMVTTEAVKTFSAYAADRGDPWSFVPAQAASAAPGERLFRGKRVVFIPFAFGAKFKIDIVSHNGGAVTVWKILPTGVNSKSWQGGNWEKEISVRGDVSFK